LYDLQRRGGAILRCEPLHRCVLCGFVGTWFYVHRGVLPGAWQRVWLCVPCFYQSGADRRSLANGCAEQRR
jgi:hypothetical protein